MNIKNYTSSVPALVSVGRIEQKLIQLGAKNINKTIVDYKAVSISFLIDINGTTVFFELPAKVDRIFNFMYAKSKTKNASTQARIYDQAERTAWKLISDWVDMQATMIVLEQADLLQVFLPYAQVSPGRSLYQAVSEQGFKLLN